MVNFGREGRDDELATGTSLPYAEGPASIWKRGPRINRNLSRLLLQNEEQSGSVTGTPFAMGFREHVDVGGFAAA